MRSDLILVLSIFISVIFLSAYGCSYDTSRLCQEAGYDNFAWVDYSGGNTNFFCFSIGFRNDSCERKEVIRTSVIYSTPESLQWDIDHINCAIMNDTTKRRC